MIYSGKNLIIHTNEWSTQDISKKKKKCKGFEKARHFLRGKKNPLFSNVFSFVQKLLLFFMRRKGKINYTSLRFRFVLNQFLVYSSSTEKWHYIFLAAESLQAFEFHLEFTVIQRCITSADKHVNVLPHFKTPKLIVQVVPKSVCDWKNCVLEDDI